MLPYILSHGIMEEYSQYRSSSVSKNFRSLLIFTSVSILTLVDRQSHDFFDCSNVIGFATVNLLPFWCFIGDWLHPVALQDTSSSHSLPFAAADVGKTYWMGISPHFPSSHSIKSMGMSLKFLKEIN